MCSVSNWFRTYGFADVNDKLLIGAYPLDAGDVTTLENMGVRRILNLVQDSEYRAGERQREEEPLSSCWPAPGLWSRVPSVARSPEALTRRPCSSRPRSEISCADSATRSC